MVGDAAYLRLSSVVTVFRIKGHASIAEDELNEFTEAGLGATRFVLMVAAQPALH